MSLSYCCCLTVTFIMSLSYCHCHTVTVTLSLSYCYCHTVTVILSVSYCQCHTVIVILSLSYCCCRATTEPGKRILQGGGIYRMVLCLHTATWPGRGPCLAETVWAGSRERFLLLFGNGSNRNREWGRLGRDSPGRMSQWTASGEDGTPGCFPGPL